MSRCNWHHFIAIVGVLGGSHLAQADPSSKGAGIPPSLKAPESGPSKKNKDHWETQKSNGPSDAPTPTVGVVENADEAKRREAREEATAQREAENLKSQQQSAAAAVSSAVSAELQLTIGWFQVAIAGIALFFGLVSTFLLWKTLIYLRNQINIASEANKINTLAIEAAFRPFFYVSEAKISISANDPNRLMTQAIVTFINGSDRIATVVKTAYSTIQAYDDHQRYPGGAIGATKQTIGPGKEFSIRIGQGHSPQTAKAQYTSLTIGILFRYTSSMGVNYEDESWFNGGGNIVNGRLEAAMHQINLDDVDKSEYSYEVKFIDEHE